MKHRECVAYKLFYVFIEDLLQLAISTQIKFKLKGLFENNLKRYQPFCCIRTLLELSLCVKLPSALIISTEHSSSLLINKISTNSVDLKLESYKISNEKNNTFPD